MQQISDVNASLVYKTSITQKGKQIAGSLQTLSEFCPSDSPMTSFAETARNTSSALFIANYRASVFFLWSNTQFIAHESWLSGPAFESGCSCSATHESISHARSAKGLCPAVLRFPVPSLPIHTLVSTCQGQTLWLVLR